MTRFLALCSATLCSILSVALFVGSSASAQTSPSVPLPITTKAVTQYQGGQEVDRTKNIYGFLRDTLPTSQNGISYSRDKFNTDFNRAMEDGTWGVYQYTWISSGKQYKRYVLFWTYRKHVDCKIQLRLSSLNYHLQSFPTVNHNDCLWRYVQSAVSDNSSSIYAREPIPSITVARNTSPDSGGRYELIFFNGEYTLGPGITGSVHLPQSTPIKTMISPHFSTLINTVNVTATHKVELDPDRKELAEAIEEVIQAETVNNPLSQDREIRKQFYIEWRILSLDNNEYSQIKHTKPGGIFTIRVPALGNYRLSAKYVLAECAKDGKPDDLTGCTVRHLTYSERFDFPPRFADVPVDGNTHAYDTDTMQCENDGIDCVPPPLYANCSVHDFKVTFWDNGPQFSIPSVDSIWCALKNFGTFLMHEVFHPLFVPNGYRVSILFENTLKSLQGSLGFLWTPVSFIQATYSGIVNNHISGDTCALPAMSLFGSSARIHLCQWRYQFPQLWQYMQIAIQGGLAIGFIWALYRSLMRLFGVHIEDHDDDDDGITVETHPSVSRHSSDYVNRQRGGMPK